MHNTVSNACKRLITLALAFVLTIVFVAVADAEPITLHGGGASFPAPLYKKWFKAYQKKHPGVQISYKSLGSGGGISNLTAKRFDFAGSDVPMTQKEIGQLEGGVVQIPMTSGAVVLIFNLAGIKDLHLSREAYTGIFLGTVTHWRHPLILEHNRGLNLPDLEITVVARVDSSGTTQVLTNHISAVNPNFAKTVGSSKKPVWPNSIAKEGRLEKVSGNGGVARMVKVLPGSIGYSEFSYAYFTNIPMASLENKGGNFVYPTSHAFLETVGSASSTAVGVSKKNLSVDPPGKGAYPILSLSWILCQKTYDDSGKLAALKDVLYYCLDEGQKSSIETGYVPIIEPLLSEAREKVDTVGVK